MAEQSLSLQPYSREEGTELLIDRGTGAVYASQNALARMCEKQASTISRWRTVAQISVLEAEAPTPTGIKTVALYDESAIKKAVLRYNPALAERMLEAGLRVYLYGIAGYEVKPKAPDLAATPLASPAISYITEACDALGKYFGPAYAESALILNLRRHHPALALPPVQAQDRTSLDSADVLLTPTDVARELGLSYSTGNPSPRAANAMLKQFGYQEKVSGDWQPTEKGKPFCVRKPVDTNSRSDKSQLMWFSSILSELEGSQAA